MVFHVLGIVFILMLITMFRYMSDAVRSKGDSFSLEISYVMESLKGQSIAQIYFYIIL